MVGVVRVARYLSLVRELRARRRMPHTHSAESIAGETASFSGTAPGSGSMGSGYAPRRCFVPTRCFPKRAPVSYANSHDARASFPCKHLRVTLPLCNAFSEPTESAALQPCLILIAVLRQCDGDCDEQNLNF